MCFHSKGILEMVNLPCSFQNKSCVFIVNKLILILILISGSAASLPEDRGEAEGEGARRGAPERQERIDLPVLQTIAPYHYYSTVHWA